MVKVEAALTVIAGQSRRSREQKNKECFPLVEGPLEPHLFSLRNREEREERQRQEKVEYLFVSFRP